MPLPLKFRLHEWLADHIKWVQYPNVRQVRRPVFKYAMPWTTRIALVLFSLTVLVFCLIALGFLALLAWAAITA